MNKVKTIKVKNEDGSISEESYSITADAVNIDMANGKNLQETIGTIDVDKDGDIAEQLKSGKQIIDRLVGLYKKYESVYTTTVENQTTVPIYLDQYTGNEILEVFIEGRILNNDEYTIASDHRSVTFDEALSEVGTVVQFVIYKFAQIDNKDYDILKGEKGDSGAIVFNNVAEMKANTELVAGDTCQTLGYYEVNDGGAGLYKITNDNNLTDDGGSVHTLENGLKAQLIINDTINIKQYGAKCDGITDDSNAILKALNNFSTIEFPANSTTIFNKRFSVNKNTTIKGNFATLLITDAEEYNVRYKAFELLNNKLLKIDNLNINASFPANSFSSWDWTLFWGTNGNIELNNVKATIDGGTTNKVNGLFIYGEAENVICNNSYIDVKAVGLAGGCCWLRSGTGDVKAEFNNTVFKQNTVDEIFGVFGKYQNNATLNNCKLIKYGTSQANQLITSYIQANNAKIQTAFNKCIFEGSVDASVANVIYARNEYTTNVLNKIFINECNFKIPSCTSFFGGGATGTYTDIIDYSNKEKVEIINSNIEITSGSIHTTGYPINVEAKKCNFSTNDREFIAYEVASIYPYEEIYEECTFKRIEDNTPTDFIQYIEGQGIVQKFNSCVQEKDYTYKVTSSVQITQAFSNDYFIELMNYRLFSDTDEIKSKRIPRSANSSNISITPTASTGTILNNKSFYNVEQRVVFLDFQLNIGNTTTDTVDINYSPSTSMSYGSISCMGYADNKYTPIGNLVTGGLLKMYTTGYSVVRVCGYLPL